MFNCYRDRWITCLYYGLHQLQNVSQYICAQIELADSGDKVNGILGGSFHMKGWTPYFPDFCFEDGVTQYPFMNSTQSEIFKKLSDNELLKVDINNCKDFCITANDEEIERLRIMYDDCKFLDKKNLRSYLININDCPVITREPYYLTVKKTKSPNRLFQWYQ